VDDVVLQINGLLHRRRPGVQGIAGELGGMIDTH
jgi:hypothetical protein